MLVVDDEPTIAEVVARYLERAGYRTRVAGDGVEAIDAAAEQRPDLVVLDLMLPGIDGLEVMRRLREQDRERIAVILLTAKGEESDRVVGLRLGADDYVVKPFSPAELVARVDAVLRRVDTSPAHEAADGDRRHEDRSGGASGVRHTTTRSQLTQREFDVLLFLARHPGQVFSRNQLMDAIWQYSFYTDTSTVTVHIRRLRAKIEADPVAAAPHPDGVGRRLSLPAMSSVRPVPSGKERGSTLPLPSFKSDRDGRELGFVSTIRARLGSLSRQFALAVGDRRRAGLARADRDRAADGRVRPRRGDRGGDRRVRRRVWRRSWRALLAARRSFVTSTRSATG